ncbi:MAG TPA: hypothetical protein VFQ00_00545 [Terriglobales bacterium]|nr:hypothetical protein [Terriglobales bacterium]
MISRLLTISLACLFASSAFCADVRVPEKTVAGQDLKIATSGSGNATLYLAGPGAAIKRDVKLGEEVQIKGEDLRKSGYYIVALKSGDGDVSKDLYVAPSEPDKINFLARPSRVPVGQPKVIAGTAFIFDQFGNLITAPTTVTFNLSVPGAPAKVARLTTKDGMAYEETGSGSKAGAGQFVVTVGDTSVRRVVEEVASEPCNLRFTVHKEKEGLIAQTDSVRDCSGNPVPDGTIVTFISTEPGQGRSTVDARVKKGVARAVLPAVPGATISAASGVVLSNTEVRWKGGE